MPDNASVTKLCCRVVDQNLKEIYPVTEQVAELEGSTLRNQRFSLVLNVKMKAIKTTALLYICLQTYSRSSKVPKIVGFSYMPLFMDKRNEYPATVDDLKEFAPMQGSY